MTSVILSEGKAMKSSNYGTPSLEFVRYKKLNKTQDIENLDNVDLRDLLVALFQAADAIWNELHEIRSKLEKA